jgi:hypothetical protein
MNLEELCKGSLFLISMVFSLKELMGSLGEKSVFSYLLYDLAKVDALCISRVGNTE